MTSILPESTMAEAANSFSYKDATQEDVMEDLTSRFILNLPDHELASLERVCFQVEQAHWFYEDFIREQNPKFPSLPLKKFSAMFFQACPLLAHWSDDHEQAFSNFMSYKTKVPVCGAIMLNETWDKCLLVKGWKASSGWGFPKGKINEDEPPASCAIREVLEETGYNLAGKVVPEDVIETTIQGQRISLFIVPGVPEDYPFKTKTRKEISKIEWFKLSELPTWKRGKTNAGRFYLITPFIGPLKSFINSRKPKKPNRKPRYDDEDLSASGLESDFYTEHSSMMSSASEVEESPAPAGASIFTGPDNVQMDPHFAQLLSGLAISANSKPLNQPNGSDKLGGSKDSATDLFQSKATPRIAQKTELPQLQALPSQRHVTEDQTPIALQNNGLQSYRNLIESQSGYKTSEPTPSLPSSIPLPLQDELYHRIASPRRSPGTFSGLPQNSYPPPRVPSSAAGNLKHIAVLEHISKESARMMESFKISQKSPTNMSRSNPDNMMPNGPLPGPLYQSPRMFSSAAAIPLQGMPSVGMPPMNSAGMPPMNSAGMPPMNSVGMPPMNPVAFPSRTPVPPAAPYPIYPISPQMLSQNYNPVNTLPHPPTIPIAKPPTAFTQITPYTGLQTAPAYSPTLSRPFSAAPGPPSGNVFQLGATANLHHTPYPYGANPVGTGENTLLSILNRPRHNSQISRPGL